MFPKYDALKKRTIELIDAGKLQSSPTLAQRIDIAYGNTKIENDAITVEMVERAAAEMIK
jgi:hypothetical protein